MHLVYGCVSDDYNDSEENGGDVEFERKPVGQPERSR